MICDNCYREVFIVKILRRKHIYCCIGEMKMHYFVDDMN